MNHILTNSALTAFKTCPRKYQIRYEMGISPVRDSEPLIFGRMMHKAVELWLRNGRTLNFLDTFFNEQLKNCVEEKEALVVNKVSALLVGYHRQYASESFEAVAIEQKFEMPLINPDTKNVSNIFRMAGMMDAIYRDKDGEIFIKETKTTSDDIEDSSSSYWRQLSIDSQISQYYLGAKILGYEPKYCLYDVVKKPAIKLKKATKLKKAETLEEYYERLLEDIEERPEFYFARKEIPRIGDDLKDYLYDVNDISEMVYSCQNKDTFPRYTNSCKTVYGVCPYFNFCTGTASLEDATLFKRDENPHVELTEGL